jgi:hypothetical protein
VDWGALRAPWEDEQVSWRVLKSFEKDKKKTLKLYPYISVGEIEKRLDRILSPGGWQPDFRTIAMSNKRAMMCRLGIWDGKKFIYREDGVPFESDGWEETIVKVATSKALRAAAGAWGIGIDTRGREILCQKIYTSRPPKDVTVVRFDQTVTHQGKAVLIDAWFAPPKISEVVDNG